MSLPECEHGEDCWYQSNPEMLREDTRSFLCERDGNDLILCDICLEGLDLEYCKECERFLFHTEHACIKNRVTKG